MTDNEIEWSFMTCEQFFRTDDDVTLHTYNIGFMWLPPADLLGIIADTINDVAAIGLSMDDIHGSIFVASIIATAVHRDVGVHIMPPSSPDHGTPRLIMYSDGGVQITLDADETPWDATMFALRFGPKEQ